MARGARTASVIGLGLGSVVVATLLVWVLSSGGDDAGAPLPAPPPPQQVVTFVAPMPPPPPPPPPPPDLRQNPLYIPLDDDPPAPVDPSDEDREAVHRLIQRNHARIRGCRQLYLHDHPGAPNADGTVRITFRLGATGTFSVHRTSASGLDDEITQCVCDVLSQLDFPAPTGGAPIELTYPFNLVSAAP
jgi:hypothetical protein